MSGKNGTNVESILFPAGTDFTTPERQKYLLEQYKMFVETSESVVARRQGVNTFFLSINSFLLFAIGVFSKLGLSKWLGGVGVTLMGATGILLCVAWKRLVRSYRQLNSGKFVIIHLLEQYLPAAVFSAEWGALGAGREKHKYTPFTPTEERIPIIFGALYGLAMAAGVLVIVAHFG